MIQIPILLTDKVFNDSPDAGTPECICSRCLKPIKEDEVPIRAWLTSTLYTIDNQRIPKLEWRYHANCLFPKP